MNEFTPLRDVVLTDHLVAESAARAANLKSRTARNVLLGSAALVAAAGFAWAAVSWADNQHGPSPEERAADLKRALAEMPPIKVDLPPVKLADGSSVALESGSKVALEKGAEVSLDQPAVVTLKDAMVKLDASTLKLPKLELPKLPPAPKAANGDPIRREVTVFNSVQFGDGEVVSGWRYPDGGSKTPLGEYCYFSRPLPTGANERIELAINRDPVPSGQQLLGGQFSSALSKCVWS